MKENINKPNAIKIGLLGDTTVGKTAIANSIIGLDFDKFNKELLATIGQDKYEKKFKLKNNEEIKLIFWDVSGMESQRSAAMKSVKSAHGIMLIFDLTRWKSFDNLNIWLNLIKNDLKEPLIILVGNKADKDKNEWQITSEEASKFAKEKGFAYFEVSAKTKIGLNEGVSYIVNGIYDKIMEVNDKKIVLDNNIKPNNNSNCAGNKKSKNNKI